MSMTGRNRTYTAVVRHTERVGIEQSQTFTETKHLDGSETIADLMVWAHEATGHHMNPQVLIVRESEVAVKPINLNQESEATQ